VQVRVLFSSLCDKDFNGGEEEQEAEAACKICKLCKLTLVVTNCSVERVQDLDLRGEIDFSLTH
jgi:hypothetical protein